jgi:hypothetical protein
MLNRIKNASFTLVGRRGNDRNIQKHFVPLNKDTKNRLIAETLIKNGTKGLHCLEAIHIGDTCLHSTISALSKRYYLEIPRKKIKVSNKRGKLITVTQYWLSESDAHIVNTALI